MDPNTRALIAGAAGATSGATYVEDVFSTWLYTGNSSTQTITNGIDLAGEGGLVWIKGRSVAYNNVFNDTERGATQQISSNQTDGQQVYLSGLTAFTSTGFSVGNDVQYNQNAATYASWTFRKAEKFFDVVTYTGTGANRTIAHSLGSVPGTIIVKRTDTAADWQVYHRSLANTEYLVLNSTAAKATGTTRWNSTTPTSSVFSLGTDTTVNASGGTYVAYLFAHDAGGFGDSGSESVIKCGSYTGNGSSAGPTITLGWEPQWILAKAANSAGSRNWIVADNMRGLPVATSGMAGLLPNTSGAEIIESVGAIQPTSTGFTVNSTSLAYNESGVTYIYIAIRRGPMKTPTDATKVFKGVARTGTGASATVNGFGFSLDAVLTQTRNSATSNAFIDRLRGDAALSTQGTSSESTGNGVKLDVMDGYTISTAYNPWNDNTTTTINWGFRRAPGFFDVVAYTGTNTSGQNAVSHNLGVTPELIIYKVRTGPTTAGWYVYAQPLGVANHLVLNTTAASASYSLSNGVSPTATAFYTEPGDSATSASGYTYIAYLFATCPGVSKVFNFTGTGTTKQIDCGFTNGARFVMIKRTDSTGDWYVWDSARGIISGNDPYLLLNSTAAEVTNTDYIDPYSAGFEISSTAPAAINANGGSYIGLAIA